MESLARVGFFDSLGIRLIDGQCDVLYRPFVVFCSFSQ